VSFREMRKYRSVAKKRAGFEKIRQTCRLAAIDGYEYAWVDSCCIDKRSSAELSEAINSMYRWYRDSAVCYTHLSDVPSELIDPSESNDAFQKSRWFTRGWTLQELIAPRNLYFFSQDWQRIGVKEALVGRISDITGIHKDVLRHGNNAKRVSVARRMAWASQRETTRVEDIAYCLMGIFDVHMPLLYGEGPKAFERLQLEIIKTSSDNSIFAFKAGTHDLLARHPKSFRNAHNITRGFNNDGYSITNTGLRIRGPLVKGYGCAFCDRKGIGLHLCEALNAAHLVLNCCMSSHPDHYVGIRICPMTPSGLYARVGHDQITPIPISEVSWDRDNCKLITIMNVNEETEKDELH